MEQMDMFGKSCFDYIMQYQIFKLLETKVMNQYILEHWLGPVDINYNILELGTPYQLINNEHGIFY